MMEIRGPLLDGNSWTLVDSLYPPEQLNRTSACAVCTTVQRSRTGVDVPLEQPARVLSRSAEGARVRDRDSIDCADAADRHVRRRRPRARHRHAERSRVGDGEARAAAACRRRPRTGSSCTSIHRGVREEKRARSAFRRATSFSPRELAILPELTRSRSASRDRRY